MERGKEGEGRESEVRGDWNVKWKEKKGERGKGERTKEEEAGKRNGMQKRERGKRKGKPRKRRLGESKGRGFWEENRKRGKAKIDTRSFSNVPCFQQPQLSVGPIIEV